VFIEGPYGNCSIPVERSDVYPVVLLISGGVGITPAQSLYNDLYFRHRAGLSPDLKRVHFVWSVRDKGDDPDADEAKKEVSVSVNFDAQSQGSQSLISEDFTSSSAMSEVDVVAAIEGGKTSVDSYENFSYALPLAFQPALRPPEKIATKDRRGSNPVDLARQISAVNPSSTSSSPLGEFQPRDSGIELRSGSSCSVAAGDVSSKITADFITDFYMTNARSEAQRAAEGEDTGSPVRVNKRPDIALIFQETTTFAKTVGCDRVAVVVCGPSSMVASVHEACVRSHKQTELSKVVFDLHVEEFCI
jgi:hypothetical protein